MRKTLILFALAGLLAGFTSAASAAEKPKLAKATFAGGCFWCMEPPFDKLPGVVSTTSGYAGGPEKNPTYEEVSSGRTGHLESVQIAYDPAKVSFAKLLEVYWRNIDPTDDRGQFCDKGPQYRSAIFFHDPEQKRLAEETKAAAAKRLGQPVVTEIRQFTAFYPAEEYHQDFYEKSSVRYKLYRQGCGRDRRLEQLWGKGE